MLFLLKSLSMFTLLNRIFTKQPNHDQRNPYPQGG
jgi:hypothetical protein